MTVKAALLTAMTALACRRPTPAQLPSDLYEVAFSTAVQGMLPIRLRLNGRMRVTRLSDASQRFELLDPQIATEPVSSDGAATFPGLGVSYFILHDQVNAPRIAFSPQTPPQTRQLLQSLAFEWCSPSGPLREATERDGTGLAHVRYVPGSAPGTFTKLKLAYSNVGRDAATIDIDHSQREIRLSPDGKTLVSVEGEERLVAPALQIRSTMNVRIRRIEQSERDLEPTSRGPDLPLALPGDYVRYEMGEAGRRTRQQEDEETVGRYTVTQLVDALRLAMNEPRPRAAAVQTLAAALRLRPNDTTILATLLAGKDSEEERLQAGLIDALGQAGTLEAQGVIVGLLNDAHSPPARRLRVLRALSFIQDPAEKLVRAVESLALGPNHDDAQVPAVYALGALAFTLAAKNSPQAARITKEIVAHLEAASTVQARIALLDALGNAGQREGMAAIARALKDPSPLLRGNALESLRRIGGADIDVMIADGLKDAVPAVRQAALSTIGYRQVDSYREILKAMAIKDEEPGLRQQALRILAEVKDEPSSMLAFFRSRSERETNPQARALALRLSAASRPPVGAK
jgi:HEAT repeat protein